MFVYDEEYLFVFRARLGHSGRKSVSIRKTRQPKAYTRIARVATERSIAECVQKCQKSAPKASERSTSTTKTTHPSPSIRSVWGSRWPLATGPCESIQYHCVFFALSAYSAGSPTRKRTEARPMTAEATIKKARKSRAKKAVTTADASAATTSRAPAGGRSSSGGKKAETAHRLRIKVRAYEHGILDK